MFYYDKHINASGFKNIYSFLASKSPFWLIQDILEYEATNMSTTWHL